jgi:FixJ family two-component response regulator
MNEVRTIYLLDDDPAIRHAVGLFLEGEGYTVMRIASAEYLLELLDDAAFGVLVLDHLLDGMSGLQLQAELKARDIDWPVIFISGCGDIGTSVRAMKAGALDFHVKPFDNNALLRSVKEACRQATRLRLTRTYCAVVTDRFQNLSPREKQVMKHIVDGFSNRDLAERLNISMRTIEVHRSRVMTKMGADTLPDLVRFAKLCQQEES